MKRLFGSASALGVFLTLVVGPAHAAVTIEQYRTHDFSFKAQVAGNPFDAEVRGEFTGPAGVRIVVPGFYDGDNTWKIRFAPTVPGAWSMRTVSPVVSS